LVLLEQLSPEDGIAKIEAIWKEYEKYEDKSSENVKNIITDEETMSGSVSMRVAYRVSGDKDVVVAMSINGTLEPNVEIRKRNLYFSVSTIPLSREFSVQPNHAYNKSVAQFNSSDNSTDIEDLVLTPGELILQEPSEGPLVMINPTINAPVAFIADVGNCESPFTSGAGVTQINVEGKVLELQINSIVGITLVILINGEPTTVTDQVDSNIVLPTKKGERITYSYKYEGGAFTMDFIAIIRDA
jgi:hypothetical protein